PHTADVWKERESRKAARFNRASFKRIIEIEKRREVGCQKRDADRVETRFRFEANVHRPRLSPATRRRHGFIPIKEPQPLSIDKDFELLPLHLTKRLCAPHQPA